MKKYSFVKLKDITKKIGSGATPKGGKESYIESGITLIRSLNVYDFKFEMQGLAFIIGLWTILKRRIAKGKGNK